MDSKFLDKDFSKFGIDKNELIGKVAIITGSAQGIGKELAHTLAKLNVNVVIADISSEGQSVADGIKKEGGNAIFICTDVSNPECVSSMVENVIGHFDRVDFLINNAIYSPVVSFSNMEYDDWNKVISINLNGAFLCIKNVLPYMEKQKSGVIINMISSTAMPYMAAYIATKQALESLSHSLAVEFEEKGINVIAFGPGMVGTPGGIAAFRKLAEIYDVTYESLTENGINIGYSGLIPAYDCSFALTYLIANAKAYNNQTIYMSDIILKLVPDAKEIIGVNFDNGIDFTYWHKLSRSTFHGIEALEKNLTAADAELEGLPFFTKPLARSVFKRKVGINIGDLKDLCLISKEAWLQSISSTEAQSELSSAASISEAINISKRLYKHLDNLSICYFDFSKEVQKFTKDPDTLKRIEAISRDGIAASSNLIGLIESLS